MVGSGSVSEVFCSTRWDPEVILQWSHRKFSMVVHASSVSTDDLKQRDHWGLQAVQPLLTRKLQIPKIDSVSNNTVSNS